MPCLLLSNKLDVMCVCVVSWDAVDTWQLFETLSTATQHSEYQRAEYDTGPQLSHIIDSSSWRCRPRCPVYYLIITALRLHFPESHFELNSTEPSFLRSPVSGDSAVVAVYSKYFMIAWTCVGYGSHFSTALPGWVTVSSLWQLHISAPRAPTLHSAGLQSPGMACVQLLFTSHFSVNS